MVGLMKRIYFCALVLFFMALCFIWIVVSVMFLASLLWNFVLHFEWWKRLDSGYILLLP